MRQLARHDKPVVADERLARRPDALLAVGRQRELRRARVPAVEGPLGLAVRMMKTRGVVISFSFSFFPFFRIRILENGWVDIYLGA